MLEIIDLVQDIFSGSNSRIGILRGRGEGAAQVKQANAETRCREAAGHD